MNEPSLISPDVNVIRWSRCPTLILLVGPGTIATERRHSKDVRPHLNQTVDENKPSLQIMQSTTVCLIWLS